MPVCAGGLLSSVTIWYEPDAAALQLVGARTAQLLKILEAASPADQRATALNTRPFHQACYTGLPPVGHDHFAGNYRGSPYCCLHTYNVMIIAAWDQLGRPIREPGVGTAAPEVSTEMIPVSEEIREALDATAALPDDERLLHIVAAAARFIAEFIRVHPYANGNGHSARFAFWALCLSLGMYPNSSFSLHDRPQGFGDNLRAWRAGDPVPLETQLLKSLS